MAERAASFQKQELQSEYLQAVEQYQKWKVSWEFYTAEALPLAAEQRAGALLAFNEGAIEYVSFIQLLEDIVQVELKALEALHKYLEAKTKLQFFINNKS